MPNFVAAVGIRQILAFHTLLCSLFRTNVRRRGKAGGGVDSTLVVVGMARGTRVFSVLLFCLFALWADVRLRRLGCVGRFVHGGSRP